MFSKSASHSKLLRTPTCLNLTLFITITQHSYDQNEDILELACNSLTDSLEAHSFLLATWIVQPPSLTEVQACSLCLNCQVICSSRFH